MPEAPASPPDPPAAAPAELAEPGPVRRVVRAVGIGLLVLDYASLSFLLWSLDMDWRVAVPLGVAVGLFTTYELQWRYLLSPAAYRAAGSKSRFVAAAAAVVAVNVGASSLLVLQLWYTYLAVRILAAVIGATAWTRWRMRALVKRGAAKP